MDLKLPNLGEGADSGTVVNIFVHEGDAITKDQPILELENEKAVATIPSTSAGKVGKIYVKPGDKLSVGQRILSLETGEASSAPAAPQRASKRQEEPAPARVAPRQPAAAAPPAEDAEPSEPGRPSTPGIPVAAAPSIRRLARDLGIDLTRVRGSARGGRILLEDVRTYVIQLQRRSSEPRVAAAPPADASVAAAPKPEPVDFAKWGPVSRSPASPLRQVIARRMSESWQAVPRVTQFDDADITQINDLRKRYAPAYEKQGTRLTLTSFAVKVVADTLKVHPLMNSSLDEAAQEIVYKQYYHIGIAVDTEAGLLVPVIRDADKKTILEISKALEELARKARDRKVSAEELKGGTFTISNQGGIGGAHFTPIVNRPEVAILGLGKGAIKPVVREDKIVPRLILPIGLSYDHRVIDGGAAARFTVDLVKGFENFKEEDVKL